MRNFARLALLLLACCAAVPAWAGDFYVAGGLGSSWATSESAGEHRFSGGAIFGEDEDEAPIYGGALGFQAGLDEVVPWFDFMPRWPLRLEFEAMGGRNYEFNSRVQGFPAIAINTDYEALTLMANFGIDLPVHPPIALLFGRVSILEPARIYASVGVGANRGELLTNDGIITFGGKSDWGFAWQAGGGISYGVSENVDLLVGYRYVDLGELTAPLTDSGNTNRGDYTFGVTANELNLQVRIKFFSIGLPYGRPKLEF